MTEERKKLGFEILLGNFLSNLGRMILVNLIFAVPLSCSLGLAYLIYQYLLPVVPIVLPLALLFASPFYSGVVVLSREYSQGKHPGGILRTYLKAFKENWLQFLIFGIILYVAFIGCYFSIQIYYLLSMESWFFYILLFVAVLVAVFFLFLFYAAFLMSASFELKFKDVLKNSALMTFGEIKQNFFATIAVAAFLAVVLAPVIVIFHLASVFSVEIVIILLLVYFCLSLGVFIPAPCAMIISNFLYPNMRAIIAGDDVSADNASAPTPDIRPRSESKAEDEGIPEIDIEKLRQGDGDEYVFYNGKMIKRKVLLQMLEKKDED